MSGHPSWCTGVLVAELVVVVGSASHVVIADGRVFSSVLKEPERRRLWRVSRTLRTAEQARASCSLNISMFFPSYKEPTVDALAPRTDEGRE